MLVGQTISLTTALTVDTGAYAAGDSIGGLLTIPYALGANSHAALLQQAMILDEGGEATALELILFDANPSSSTITDQSPVNIADGDLSKIAGVAPITSFVAFSANGMGYSPNLALPIRSTSATLYAALVCRAAVTFDATDAVQLKLTLIQDA